MYAYMYAHQTVALYSSVADHPSRSIMGHLSLTCSTDCLALTWIGSQTKTN